MRGNALFSVPQHYNVCSAVPEYLRSSSLQYCVCVDPMARAMRMKLYLFFKFASLAFSLLCFH